MRKFNQREMMPKPKVYKMIDLLIDEEVLATVDYEKANLGKKKSRRTKEFER